MLMCRKQVEKDVIEFVLQKRLYSGSSINNLLLCRRRRCLALATLVIALGRAACRLCRAGRASFVRRGDKSAARSDTRSQGNRSRTRHYSRRSRNRSRTGRRRGTSTTTTATADLSHKRTLGLPILDQFLLNLIGLLVRIQILEHSALFLNLAIFEIAIAVCKVFGIEGLCTVFCVHGVDEGGFFVVAKVGEVSYIEGGHHIVVFVDQVVAVEHVETIPADAC